MMNIKAIIEAIPAQNMGGGHPYRSITGTYVGNEVIIDIGKERYRISSYDSGYYVERFRNSGRIEKTYKAVLIEHILNLKLWKNDGQDAI